MNKVFLCGRLTANPVVTTTVSDIKRAVFTLAIDRRRKDADGQSSADFIRVTCFGNRAEFIEKYLSQGDKISVIGRIQTGSYNNKNGVKVYTTDVICDEVEIIQLKKRNNESTKVEENQAVPSNFVEMDDDDELPFN